MYSTRHVLILVAALLFSNNSNNVDARCSQGKFALPSLEAVQRIMKRDLESSVPKLTVKDIRRGRSIDDDEETIVNGTVTDLVKRSISDQSNVTAHDVRVFKRQDGTAPAPRITVPVHVNVFCSKDSKPKTDNINEFCAPSELIEKQIELLKQAFKSEHSRIDFEFASHKVIKTNRYAGKSVLGSDGSTIDVSAITMLNRNHKGEGKSALNLYFRVIPEANTLGMNILRPEEVNESNQKLDGIIIDVRTLPGVEKYYTGKINGVVKGSAENGQVQHLYTGGATVIHETGHWFGLYHTVDKGCDADEIVDGIADDTPREHYDKSNESFKDCTPRNTCPGQDGNDAIQNFMNWTPDTCMTGFTKGQLELMAQNYLKYRAKKQ